MSISPIDNPLPGERVIALAPDTAGQASTVDLKRPNWFAGRSLTQPTLQGRQHWALHHLQLRGQAFTPGIAKGLEIGYTVLPPAKAGEPSRVRIAIGAGHGLTVAGEDLVLVRQAEFDLLDLPVIVPDSLRPTLGDTAILGKIKEQLSSVGMVLLQPVAVDVGDFDPNDPCELCPCGTNDTGGSENISYEDWRIADAVRAVWYPWPEGKDWQPLPAAGPRQRNWLAYKIFQEESELAEGDSLPWEAHGLALGLIAVDVNFIPQFIDRHAVARRGGQPRDSRLQGMANAAKLQTNSRLPPLWQARLEQLAAHIGELNLSAPKPEEFLNLLRNSFAWLPPVGLLPPEALNLARHASEFFPDNFDLDAVPVPLEQLDSAIRQASALTPFDFSLGERLRVLVPVPQSVYEPELLQTLEIDPEFDAALRDFLLARARRLGARQSLKVKLAKFDNLLRAAPPQIAALSDDPLALEEESLSDWGPPPIIGGGHRAALQTGLHQHFFDRASDTLRIAATETFYVWVYLDPDNPPKTLMLQWNIRGSWDHRAYWGDDLIPWGINGTASRRRIDDLPLTGQWIILELPPGTVGIADQPIGGLAFTLFDGRAAFGPCGRQAAGSFFPWATDQLPSGAVVRGDYPWQFLSANDLWAPFEPAFGFTVPVRPKGGGHRTQIRGGNHEYVFINASATLAVAANQVLFVWVYLDPFNPPNGLMFQWCGDSWEHRAYWGDNLFNLGTEGQASCFRLGQLPIVGRWVRLDVPVGLVGLAGQTVTGMAFNLYNGRAAFGPAGKLADGQEAVWFSRALPDGAVQVVDSQIDFPWTFLPEADLANPFVSVPGTPPDYPEPGTHAALQALAEDGALAVLSVRERAQLPVLGLERFIAYLQSRADRADDLTDYGFVKVQTDIYRLRQLMLDKADASRLNLSPVLANIAKAETATVAQEKVTDFLKNIKFNAVAMQAMTAAKAEAEQAAAAPAPRTLFLAEAATEVSVSNAARTTAINTVIKEVIAANPPSTITAFKSPLEPAVSEDFQVPRSMIGGAFVTDRFKVGKAIALETEIKPITVKPPKQTVPSDIVDAGPLVGNPIIRTVSIAERLAAPKATEARDYVTATRHEGVFKLIRLADELTAEDGGIIPGLFDGIDIHGLDNEDFLKASGNLPASTNRKRPLKEFILQREMLLPKLLTAPPAKIWRDASGKEVRVLDDEAQHFSDSADLADNSVALLRQLEGRIKLYRNAVDACRRVLGEVLTDRQFAQARLGILEEDLAEARHDVAVTRALIAEEQVRIAAINARRQQVLAGEVRFLAYLRPRETDNLLSTPARSLDPGLLPAAVPACLAQHEDAPDELQDLLRVVREAPAAWFKLVPALLDKLDRTDLLVKTLQSAQIRSQIVSLAASTVSNPAVKLQNAVINVQAKQQLAVSQARAVAMRLDLQALSKLSWQSVASQAAEVVSLGDLIDGQHGRGAVSLQAAEHFEQISRLCACLHAEFSAVLPSIRLDWAESLSEFDDPPPLRNLASLPRWGEIGYIDRRQMQAYVDWLFDQIRPVEPRAETLMNDVVRMCLLLASHSPIDRIVAGRLARPVTARVGERIPLTVFEPAKLRVGMTALVYKGSEIVTRAIVEDIGTDEASARVLQTSTAAITLDQQVRVQFTAMRMVSGADKLSLFAAK